MIRVPVVVGRSISIVMGRRRDKRKASLRGEAEAIYLKHSLSGCFLLYIASDIGTIIACCVTQFVRSEILLNIQLLLCGSIASRNRSRVCFYAVLPMLYEVDSVNLYTDLS